MKKLISFILVLTLCLATGVLLTSCGEHEHVAQTEWEHSSQRHWHKCEKSGCSEMLDEGVHVFESFSGKDESRHTKTCVCGYSELEAHHFDNGVVESEPIKGNPGVTVYTCADCRYEKRVSVSYVPKSTVSESEAEDALNMVGATEYTVKITGDNDMHARFVRTYQFNGTTVCDGSKQYTWYWIIEDSVKYQIYQDKGTWVKKTSDTIVKRYDYRMNIMKNLLGSIDFANQFVKEGNHYVGTNVRLGLYCDIADEQAFTYTVYDKVRLYFEDNQLVKITMDYGEYSYASIQIEYKTNFTVPTVE